MSASAAQMELGELRPADPSPLDLRFQTFDRENPDVFRALVRLARAKVARQGAKGEVPRISGNALIFAARWNDDDEALAALPFINNSFASRYARKIAAECIDLAEVFELRLLHDEGGA